VALVSPEPWSRKFTWISESGGSVTVNGFVTPSGRLFVQRSPRHRDVLNRRDQSCRTAALTSR
jgi:hypothetical protein